MSKQNEAVAKRLRQLRGKRTQQAVAAAVGVTAMAISHYEHGKRMPMPPIMAKLAREYGTTVDELFFNF